LAAVVLFQLLVATPPRLVAWTVPFLCAAASLAVAWTLVGTAGALVFVPGIAGVAFGAARYGALPWGSRVLGPWASRRHFRGACVLFTGLLAIAPARAVAVPAAAVAGLAAATIASVASWQWRFDPRARARDAVVLGAAAVVAVTLYPHGARAGDGWSVVVYALVVVATALVGLPAVRLVRAVASPEDATPTAESDSAGRGTRRR